MIKKIRHKLEHVPPRALKKLLSGCIWEGDPSSGTLALTFDDGPDPDITPRVLDTLDSIGAKGTFFLTGTQARKHPDIVLTIHERGHDLGNHGMTHRRMLLLKKREVESEIDDTRNAIADAAGIEPALFRPPYGLFDLTVSRAVNDRGLAMVLWTALSGDYSDDPPEKILTTVRPFIRPGAIQVFHDTVSGGGTDLSGIVKKIGAEAGDLGIRLGTVADVCGAETGKRTTAP